MTELEIAERKIERERRRLQHDEHALNAFEDELAHFQNQFGNDAALEFVAHLARRKKRRG